MHPRPHEGPRGAAVVGATALEALVGHGLRKVEAGVVRTQPVGVQLEGLRIAGALDRAGDAAAVARRCRRRVLQVAARTRATLSGLDVGPGTAVRVAFAALLAQLRVGRRQVEVGVVRTVAVGVHVHAQAGDAAVVGRRRRRRILQVAARTGALHTGSHVGPGGAARIGTAARGTLVRHGLRQVEAGVVRSDSIAVDLEPGLSLGCLRDRAGDAAGVGCGGRRRVLQIAAGAGPLHAGFDVGPGAAVGIAAAAVLAQLRVGCWQVEVGVVRAVAVGVDFHPGGSGSRRAHEPHAHRADDRCLAGAEPLRGASQRRGGHGAAADVDEGQCTGRISRHEVQRAFGTDRAFGGGNACPFGAGPGFHNGHTALLRRLPAADGHGVGRRQRLLRRVDDEDDRRGRRRGPMR